MKIFLCLKRLRSGGMENASDVITRIHSGLSQGGGEGFPGGEETPRGGNQSSFCDDLRKKAGRSTVSSYLNISSATLFASYA